MSSKVTVYDLLVSCPGDVGEAIDVINEVVDGFNQKYNSTINIGIRTRHWKKSSFPQSGGKPQALLNKQFVEDCDLAVAIFKTRFGTPTDRYGSGTEEEIEIMLNAGRQVFLYFDDSPVSPSVLDSDQFQKVKDFEKKYRDKGIYFSFKTLEEFRKVFDAHISQYFLTLEKVNEITSNRPELKVCADCDGRFEQNAVLKAFSLGTYGKSIDIVEQIKNLIDEIPNYEVSPKVNPILPSMEFLMPKEVEIKDTTKDFIDKCTEGMGIKLAENFYDLGNLRETQSLSIVGGNSLKGSEAEIDKYNSIIELKDLFYRLSTHLEMEEYYSSLSGIQLILCNDGTTFDEDIEVVLKLAKSNAVLPTELRVPNHEVHGDDTWCFEDIFEIGETKDYISHEESRQKTTFASVNKPALMFPFQKVDYEEEYMERIKEIFDYKYYDDGDYLIIKCHFDYIKQHQRVAFPTWLFLKNVDSEIEIAYTITSKKLADVKTGAICVKKDE